MRRTPLRLLVAIGVLLSVVGSTHGYFAARLVGGVALPAPWSWFGHLAVWSLCALLFVHPTAERTFGPKAGRVLAWPSYLWLGSCLYLLIGLGASDVVMHLGDLSGLPAERGRALAVLGFAGMMTLLGMLGALRVPAVRRVEVELPDWPAALDGYRLVQLSDVHIGSILRRGFARGLVARCNALQADAIAITGDLVDGRVHQLEQEVAPFAALRARDGVFFVTGNHDHYSGADAWAEHLASLGIAPLRNRRVRIERDGASFALAGVDDLSSRRARPASRGFDLDAALADWDGREPLVLLAHDPRTFELAHRRGVHLQLSGHTHDGQLWPFRYMVRLQTRWLAGLYRLGESALYVSRGTGFWGPPMRILAPAEITELVLRTPEKRSPGSQKPLSNRALLRRRPGTPCSRAALVRITHTMRMRACVVVLVSTVMLVLAGCAGGDDGEPGGGNPTGACTPGTDSKMMVGTAMDPCPQDKCGDDVLVPGTDNDYITVAPCPAAAAAGAMSTWGTCACQPKCGNGVRQAGEACDGSDLGGVSCMTMGKTGVARCTAQCVIDATMCIAGPVATAGAGG